MNEDVFKQQKHAKDFYYGLYVKAVHLELSK